MVNTPPSDWPVLLAEDVQAAGFALWQIEEAGWIKRTPDRAAPEHRGATPLERAQVAMPEAVLVTAAGWNTVADLDRAGTGANRYQAFVAMWFAPDLAAAYDDGIAPAVRDAGYEPRRIDRVEHIRRIDDEIIAEIRRSRFVVADFTGHRGGVHFEAGLAQGLGLPVAWTCHRDQMGDCHFDTRHYNHIVWTTPEELREKLRNRIRATIGPP